MNRLKKLWSLSAIVGMMVGIFPMSIFAETTEAAGVVINQALLTDTDDQEITEDNRVKQKDTIKAKLNWSLAEATLVEDNTLVAVDLPANLNFPDQSGSLADGMGNYQVANQQLLFQFAKNYEETEDGRAPEFSSAKFYEGLLELTAETTAEDLETEQVDFGNNLVSTIYYDKKVDPAADPLEKTEVKEEKKEVQPRAHEPNLNLRGVDLFTNIKITDLNDKEFSDENPAVKDANIKIHFDWALDNTETILNGDYFTYQLPEYFSVHNPVTDDLKKEDGDVMGAFSLDQNGLLTVTFNDKNENLSDRQGTIDLRTELNIKTDTETVEIPTNITDKDGDEIKIVLPVVKADISKKGIIESDNTVTWTIVVNEEKRDLRNVIIRDTLPEGLSIWYHKYYVMENNDWVETTANTGFFQAWQDGGDYVYKFSSEIMNKPFKIVLKMKLEDKTKKEFLNKATISGSNFIPNSSEASVSFNEKNNYKLCTDYDLNTGKFNWEVKATYTHDGGILKDWMYSRYGEPNTANHYLLKDSIKVYDETGTLVPTNKWSFSEEAEDFKQKDSKYVHFTLKFVDKGVYKITYTTQSFEVPTPIKTELMNTAVVIDGTETDEIHGGVKPDVEGTLGVEKIATGKDFSDNTIDWKITVNKNRLLMKNAVITDKFSTLAGGEKISSLQLIESSLSVVANDGTIDKSLNKDTDYLLKPIDGDSDYSTGFIIELIGAYKSTKDQITISYSTNYFMDKQDDYGTGALQRFNNSALVTYTGEDGKSHTDGAEVSTWVDVKFAYNGVKYGKYLAKDKEVVSAFSHANPFDETNAAENSVYWTALFNSWKTTIPAGTTIKEELGEGQELKELVIYDVDIASNKVEVSSLGSKWEEGTDYEYSLDNGVPIIKLLKDTKKTFAIFVSAKAADEYHKYKNVATMTVKDTDPLKVEGMVEKSDKTAWLDKKGNQGEGTNYRLINWSVVLNKDGHKVINPIVTDTVKINEQTFVYDADKNVVVKVYKAMKDGKGTFVKDGPAIDFPEDRKPEITSDATEGTQTLTLNLGESIDTPYIIEYQTLLDPGVQNNEVINNSASLYGKDIQYHEVSTNVTVKSTIGEGTSSGKNGSIKFRKVDESNQLITTDSAFFDLYRKDKDGNLSLMFSNIEVKGDKIIEDGSEIDQLSNLRYGTYVIVESKAPDGFIKDDTEHEVEISAAQTNHTFTLENKDASKLSTSVTLEAKKELSGRPLTAGEFSFTLKGDDGVDQTKKNNGAGEVTFDEITYNKEGTYKYEISEAIPGNKETGVTYDDTKYEVTVTVELKAGKLETTVVYKDVAVGEVPTFKNTYKALPGSIVLEAEKELDGRTLKADEFSFTLKGDGGVNQTKKNNAAGKVTFDKISYDTAGTYEYTISEVVPATPETGVTYDKATYKVKVTVEEKAGKMETTVEYENVKASEVPVFKNVYKALPGTIQLEAKKELSGRTLKADEFSFTLKGDGGVDQTKKNDKDGKVLFDAITYDKAGTYEYTISEVVPTTPETGVTYDKATYKVKVTVEEKSGKLEATVEYENVKTGEVPVFKNIYKALPGTIQLEAKKELSGRPLKADEFSFTLKGDDGVDQTKKNDKDGKVLFDAITYDKAGTYEYMISEKIPAAKETGVTYDDTKYKVIVTVEEKAGQMMATAVYESLQANEIPTFKNTYKALPGTIHLEAKKELSGRPLKADDFSFTLKGDGGVDQTKKNDKDGKVTFDQISYDKAGTYKYTISEATPATPEIGITYDNTQYEVTVTVEEKAGKLEAIAVYETGEVPTFKNTYKALPGSIQLEAKKELSGRPLKADEFSFSLKGNNVDQTKNNDADGKILFDQIDYDQAGTYEYAISEAIPTDKETGLTYDEAVYKVTVTVVEEAGKLKAKVDYESLKACEVPTFKNEYKALPGSIQLEAKKELDGRSLKADEFSFNLKGDNVDQTKKNAADGKVIFDEITYDQAGTYEYTISESIPTDKEMGITYDDTQYKVSVKVEDKAGMLEATATYENVKAGELPVFKNLYTPEKKVPTGEILLRKIDSKTGRTLANAEFKLVDDKGQVVAGKEKIVTGEDGSIFIKGLADGEYQIIETKAPDGYLIDETPIKFSVKNNQPSKKEINQENDPLTLPETSNSSNKTTNVQTTYRNATGKSTTVAKRLPSTGSIQSKGLVILGLFFLAMFGLVVFGKRKNV
ncbi:MAG: Spy0128 family protein [Enterococcus sp.]